MQTLSVMFSFRTFTVYGYINISGGSKGKFSRAQKIAAEQGRKALFSFLKTCNKNYFNIDPMLSVFDTYVNSILSYGSEVWGFHWGQDIEQIHDSFVKDY